MKLFNQDPGTVLVFPTAPYTKSSIEPTGRFAAVKVISHDSSNETTLVAILDYVSTVPPDISNLEEIGVMCAAQMHDEAERLLFLNVSHEILRESAVLEFLPIGKIELTDAEISTRSSRFVWMGGLSTQVEAAWRSRFDKANFDSEILQVRADSIARRTAIEKRQRERLRGITLDVLLAETQFESWGQPDSLVPASFLIDLRKQARSLLLILNALGPRPKRAPVRKAMRAFVEWINAENSLYDNETPVETSEREDLCEFLEEVSWACRQKILVDEIDDWRDW